MNNFSISRSSRGSGSSTSGMRSSSVLKTLVGLTTHHFSPDNTWPPSAGGPVASSPAETEREEKKKQREKLKEKSHFRTEIHEKTLRTKKEGC